MRNVLAVILGGGAGTRLFPLTHMRSKPAVPFAGKYRIIDVPVSNCLNAGVNRIFILTQFNSASLNHHITDTYRFSQFTRGFVNVLAAEQTPVSPLWFQGTADAVRRSLHHLEGHRFTEALVLSGDQLYQMDFSWLVAAHRRAGADVTVAATPVTARDATAFGIMRTDATGRIVSFAEKPAPEQLAGLESDTGDAPRAQGRVFLASMGIYVFDRQTLFRLLVEHPDLVDFGRHVIPLAIDRLRAHAYRFDGYWTDIGTIASFFEANLALCEPLPRLNLYDADNPVYTHARMLPPTKTQRCYLDHALLGQGAVLEGCTVERSIVGVRGIVAEGVHLKECVVMGADHFETAAERARNLAAGKPDVGVGAGSRLSRVIVDKGARIGRGCVVTGEPGRPDEDGAAWFVRDGIVIVPKDGVVPDNTVI
jgi:glucose-1-phosphate adenylyltransferase